MNARQRRVDRRRLFRELQAAREAVSTAFGEVIRGVEPAPSMWSAWRSAKSAFDAEVVRAMAVPPEMLGLARVSESAIRRQLVGRVMAAAAAEKALTAAAPWAVTSGVLLGPEERL